MTLQKKTISAIISAIFIAICGLIPIQDAKSKSDEKDLVAILYEMKSDVKHIKENQDASINEIKEDIGSINKNVIKMDKELVELKIHVKTLQENEEKRTK